MRIGRKRTEVHEVDKETLEVKSIIRLDPGQSATPDCKTAVFTDGNLLGLIQINNYVSKNRLFMFNFAH